MIDLELIILLMIIVTNIAMYMIWLNLNKLEKRIEHLTVWAEELEDWIEEGGDAYIGLNFDVDLAREEIREEVITQLNKKNKGDK